MIYVCGYCVFGSINMEIFVVLCGMCCVWCVFVVVLCVGWSVLLFGVEGVNGVVVLFDCYCSFGV